MRRDLEQAKRLELGLIKVRWLLVAYGLVQTFVERVDPNAPSYAFELGLVLTVGMLLSNLFFTQFVQQARRPSDLHWVGSRGVPPGHGRDPGMGVGRGAPNRPTRHG